MLAFSPFAKKIIWGLSLLLIMVINYLISGYNEQKRIRVIQREIKE